MDFWIDIAFAVLLRLLKNKTASGPWRKAFLKLWLTIGDTFQFDNSLPDSLKP